MAKMRNLLGKLVSCQGKAVLGCHACPADRVSRVRKVLGLHRIRRRRAMLWAQSPGREENRKGLELIGPAGRLLWEAMAAVGLTRAHFDIQNVMRCWPIDSDGEEHRPTPHELACCEAYNDAALERNGGRAVVHLILGEVAGMKLLGSDYKKSRPVFWYAPWNAMVVLAPHPSYVLRSGGKKAGWIYEEFLNRLMAVRQLLKHPGPWGHLKAQNYGAVTEHSQMVELRRQIQRQVRAGRRISVDIEAGTVGGKRVLLMVGFGWGEYTDYRDRTSWQGGARSVVLDHPEGPSPKVREGLREQVRQILEDAEIPKVLQHGSSDADELRQIAGIRLRGYNYDTQYSCYLYNPALRVYGLAAIATRFFPEFADYKHMISPWVGDAGDGNYADVPLRQLVLYNCADCDVTKRAEAVTAPKVLEALVEVYVHDAFILDRMERHGPRLDRPAHERLSKAIAELLTRTETRLRQLAGRADFNPNTPEQVAWLLFEKLRLPRTENTQAEALEALYQEHKHPAIKLVLRQRMLRTMKSTFLEGYKRSADLYGGELHTIWWLTGAATGRLRSGRSDAEEVRGIINFQNLHGNPLLQNLLVSDENWRQALDWTDADDVGDLEVLLAFDYSQIEIRMLAEVSKDPLLIQQFRSGKDIHCLVGHTLTGWPVERIAKDRDTRRTIKTFHFALVYGVGESGMVTRLRAEGLKATPAKVHSYFTKYFRVYQGVRRFIDRTRAWVEEKGYTDSLFGFRRHIRILDNGDGRQSYWANQAVNTPIQGSAHQLVLMALAMLHLKPKTYNHLQNPLMEVHDALFWRVKLRHLAAAYQQAKYLLEQGVVQYAAEKFKVRLQVPLVAEAKAGFCMGSMVDYTGQARPEFLEAWRAKHKEVEAKSWEELLEEK